MPLPTRSASLQLIRENIYELALLDFNLPDMNGVMLHHQIRQMDAELASRTIFHVGPAPVRREPRVLHVAERGFIAKPFDIRDVLRQVRSVLEDESSPQPLAGALCEGDVERVPARQERQHGGRRRQPIRRSSWRISWWFFWTDKPLTRTANASLRRSARSSTCP